MFSFQNQTLLLFLTYMKLNLFELCLIFLNSRYLSIKLELYFCRVFNYAHQLRIL